MGREEGSDLAFHKENADRRKEWIAKWRDVSQVDDIEAEPDSVLEDDDYQKLKT